MTDDMGFLVYWLSLVPSEIKEVSLHGLNELHIAMNLLYLHICHIFIYLYILT